MFFRKLLHTTSLRWLLRCSFCRRSESRVNKLVAGARGYICDRCADEVIRIMNGAPPADAPARQPVVVSETPSWHRTWQFSAAID